jgi:hypothetical protein
VHQLEGVVDLVERHGVSDQVVDVDFPVDTSGKYSEVECAHARETSVKHPVKHP